MNDSDAMGQLLHEYRDDLLQAYPNTYGHWKDGACFNVETATWTVQFLDGNRLVRFTRTRDGQETCQSRVLTTSELEIWKRCYSQHLCQNFDAVSIV